MYTVYEWCGSRGECLGAWERAGNGGRFEIKQLLFADDTALLAECEEKLLLLLRARSIEENKQLAGECHRSSGLLMLCCALMCGRVGHYVCEAVGVSATVCADFFDGVICSLLVNCQSSAMAATKPAKMYSVRTW